MNTSVAARHPGTLAPSVPADRIVIVDDEPIIVDALTGVLRQAGFDDVVGLTDSRDALDLIAEIDADLVILDLMMPHVDGYQVLAALRAREVTRGYLPILVTTADTSPEARALALALEATEVLVKPVGPRYLARLARDLLDLRHGAHPALASGV
ncbi:MAG: response regulator [Trueperaceae bacterium]|nr:response regulator [Trueperaceae bacterium]